MRTPLERGPASIEITRTDSFLGCINPHPGSWNNFTWSSCVNPLRATIAREVYLSSDPEQLLQIIDDLESDYSDDDLMVILMMMMKRYRRE